MINGITKKRNESFIITHYWMNDSVLFFNEGFYTHKFVNLLTLRIEEGYK